MTSPAKAAERWLPIPSYRGRYHVSSFGRVKSVTWVDAIGRTIRGRIMVLFVSAKGYHRIDLYKDGRVKRHSVHGLVLRTFKGKAPSKRHECNHRNQIKTDNRPVNLEWATPSQNTQHTYDSGRISLKGSQVWASKLEESDIPKIRALLKDKMPQTRIADLFGVTQSLISYINRRKIWTQV